MAEIADKLETELRTYDQQKGALLQQHEGKYVLIKGDKVLGVFDTKSAAVAAGHQQVGPEPFLVKHVERAEKPVRIFLPRG